MSSPPHLPPGQPSALRRWLPWGCLLGGVGSVLLASTCILAAVLAPRLPALLTTRTPTLDHSATQAAAQTATAGPATRAALATATAQADLQATARREATGTARARSQATGTAEARRMATGIARLAATGTGVARITATAEAIAGLAATAEASQILLFGPRDGELPHDGDDFIEVDYADVDVRDFIAEARFYNPYPTRSGAWDYGFLFRDTHVDGQYRLVIASNQQWFLTNLVGGDFEALQDGPVSTLDTSPGGSNLVRLVSVGERGLLYVNGAFVAVLDLSDRMSSGEVSVATGLFGGNEIAGEATRYEHFTVWYVSP